MHKQARRIYQKVARLSHKTNGEEMKTGPIKDRNQAKK